MTNVCLCIFRQAAQQAAQREQQAARPTEPQRAAPEGKVLAFFYEINIHIDTLQIFGRVMVLRQILAELWSLTLRIFTHFSLSSQLLLHHCMDLNETWQGCCTTSVGEDVGK